MPILMGIIGIRTAMTSVQIATSPSVRLRVEESTVVDAMEIFSKLPSHIQRKEERKSKKFPPSEATYPVEDTERGEGIQMTVEPFSFSAIAPQQ